MNSKNIFRRLKFLTIVLAGNCLCSIVSPQTQSETQVKAAYLYNFARFVEWPQRSPLPETSPIVIGIANRTKFTDALKKLLESQTLNGRPLVVKELDGYSSHTVYQMIFIPESSSDQIPVLLDRFRGSDTLTVGESDAFLLQGGMVSLFVEDNKVRFAINKKAIDRAGLKISAQMLQYAKVLE